VPSSPVLTDAEAAALVAIDDAWNRETFPGPSTPVGFLAGSDEVHHPNWPPDTPAPTRDAVRRLGQLELLVFDREQQPDWVFWPSEDGQAVARQLRGQAAAEYEPFPGTHEWLDMLRVIAAVADAFDREGTVGIGVKAGTVADALGCSPHDPNLHSALFVLAEADYLHFREVGDLSASWVRPAPRALEYVRGWPSRDPDLVTRRLDEALVTAIERTDDPEEKTRLQRVRSAIGDISKTVVAGLVLEVGKGAV
jgi:hypothetical protein